MEIFGEINIGFKEMFHKNRFIEFKDMTYFDCISLENWNIQIIGFINSL